MISRIKNLFSSKFEKHITDKKELDEVYHNKSHKHHELILRYSFDALFYRKPWLLWEINYASNDSGFRKCNQKDMCFYTHRTYRRIEKPSSSLIEKANS